MKNLYSFQVTDLRIRVDHITLKKCSFSKNYSKILTLKGCLSYLDIDKFK